MCALLITIHYVAYALLLLPIIEKLDLKSTLVFVLPITLLVGLFLATSWSNAILIRIPIIGVRLASTERRISLYALSERTLTLLVVVFYYLSIGPKGKVNDPWWIKTYVLGHVLYFFFLGFTNFGTRIFICFKVLEVMFIPNLIKTHKKNSQIVTVYFLLLSIVMYIHNIKGYIDQGSYYVNINVINYPYLNIFNPGRLLDVRYPDLFYRFLD